MRTGLKWDAKLLFIHALIGLRIALVWHLSLEILHMYCSSQTFPTSISKYMLTLWSGCHLDVPLMIVVHAVTWLGSFTSQWTQLCTRLLISLVSQSSLASYSRYRNLPPSVIRETSPNGSDILATLLRIPRFVGSVLSDGKFTLMMSLSLPTADQV